MDIIDGFRNKIKGRGLKVVLPEGGDERIVQAAVKLKEEDLAMPVVLGKDEEIAEAAKKAGIVLENIETINPKQSSKLRYIGKGPMEMLIWYRSIPTEILFLVPG